MTIKIERLTITEGPEAGNWIREEFARELLAALIDARKQLDYGDYAGIGDPDTDAIDAVIAKGVSLL